MEKKLTPFQSHWKNASETSIVKGQQLQVNNHDVNGTVTLNFTWAINSDTLLTAYLVSVKKMGLVAKENQAGYITQAGKWKESSKPQH